MMNFPASPTVGQQYSFGDKTWEYNGIGWQARKQPDPLKADLIEGLVPLAQIPDIPATQVTETAERVWITPTQRGLIKTQTETDARYALKSELASRATAAQGTKADTAVQPATLTNALSFKADTTALTDGLAGKADLSSGKVPLSQIPDTLIGNVNYQGAWDAAANSPAIPTASAANRGHYRIVNTTGTTNISGISDWRIGDWIISNGEAWDKIDNTDAVWAVAGLTGDITSIALKTALAIAIADVSGLTAALAETTNASNLTSGTVPTARIAQAGSSARGTVTLSDAVTNNSSAVNPVAATPLAVKTAYDLAAGKQSPATSLAGYGISDAYTKTYIDALPAAPVVATVAEVWAGTVSSKYVPPSILMAAMEYVAFTTSVNLAAGINFFQTLTTSRSISNAINGRAGQTGVLVFTQDGTGGRTVSWNTYWDFGEAGVPVITPGAGKVSVVTYVVLPGAASARCSFIGAA